MPKKLSEERRTRCLYELFYRCEKGAENFREVAKLLGIGHTLAGEILADAKKRGQIETIMHHEPIPDDTLGVRFAAHCKEKFGIEKAVVLPTPTDDRELQTPSFRAFLRRTLGDFAARFLADLTELQTPGAVVAIGGGRTMMEMCNAWLPPMKDLVMRPLALGGRWRNLTHVDAGAVLQALYWRLSLRYETEPRRLRVVCPEAPPAFVAEMRSGRYPEVQAMLADDLERPAVVITSIGRVRYKPPEEGGPVPHPDTGTFVQLLGENLYFQEKRSTLTWREAYDPVPDEYYRKAYDALTDEPAIVTDISRWGIMANGEPKEGFLEKASLAVDPRTIREWRANGTTSIVVVGGSDMAPSLLAALKGRYFNVAIVDTAIANRLLPREERPEAYQHIWRDEDLV